MEPCCLVSETCSQRVPRQRLLPKHALQCLGNEPTDPHFSFIFCYVVDMTDDWGPPEGRSPGLKMKATPTQEWSIYQFTPQAHNQLINQSEPADVTAVPLRWACSEVVATAMSPAKAEGLEVSGRRKWKWFFIFFFFFFKSGFQP